MIKKLSVLVLLANLKEDYGFDITEFDGLHWYIFDVSEKNIYKDNSSAYALEIFNDYYSDVPRQQFHSRIDTIRGMHDDKDYKQRLLFVLPGDNEVLLEEIGKLLYCKKELFVFDGINICGL